MGRAGHGYRHRPDARLSVPPHSIGGDRTCLRASLSGSSNPNPPDVRAHLPRLPGPPSPGSSPGSSLGSSWWPAPSPYSSRTSRRTRSLSVRRVSRQRDRCWQQAAGTLPAWTPPLRRSPEDWIVAVVLVAAFYGGLALLAMAVVPQFRGEQLRRLSTGVAGGALLAGLLWLIVQLLLAGFPVDDHRVLVLVGSLAWGQAALTVVVLSVVLVGLASLLLPGRIRAVLTAIDVPRPDQDRPADLKLVGGPTKRLGMCFSGGGIRRRRSAWGRSRPSRPRATWVGRQRGGSRQSRAVPTWRAAGASPDQHRLHRTHIRSPPRPRCRRRGRRASRPAPRSST